MNSRLPKVSSNCCYYARLCPIDCADRTHGIKKDHLYFASDTFDMLSITSARYSQVIDTKIMLKRKLMSKNPNIARGTMYPGYWDQKLKVHCWTLVSNLATMWCHSISYKFGGAFCIFGNLATRWRHIALECWIITHQLLLSWYHHQHGHMNKITPPIPLFFFC